MYLVTQSSPLVVLRLIGSGEELERAKSKHGMTLSEQLWLGSGDAIGSHRRAVAESPSSQVRYERGERGGAAFSGTCYICSRLFDPLDTLDRGTQSFLVQCPVS